MRHFSRFLPVAFVVGCLLDVTSGSTDDFRESLNAIPLFFINITDNGATSQAERNALFILVCIELDIILL
eukprot:m.209518 g.209518  ORF g.209518 m.209518 type:complete len:70 (-) comp18986_c0_seq2:1016-1225(-)